MDFWLSPPLLAVDAIESADCEAILKPNCNIVRLCVFVFGVCARVRVCDTHRDSTHTVRSVEIEWLARHLLLKSFLRSAVRAFPAVYLGRGGGEVCTICT